MKTIERVWPVLLAATFVAAVWVTAAPAVEPSGTTAAQQTLPEAAKAKPTAKTARRTKRVTGLRPSRLTSRFYAPAIGYDLPLFLGVGY